MPEDVTYTVYCPRCDRPYKSDKSKKAAMDVMEHHLREQHPDYQPFEDER